MNTFTRTAAGLLVGGALVLGGGVACATPHTPQGYVSEMRDTMSEVDSASVSDLQLIQTGKMMCAMPETLELAENDGAETDAGPEYVEFTRLTKDYCDVLLQPGSPSPFPGTSPYGDTAAMASSSPAALPPEQITVGGPVALNYGGEDIATWTVDKVDRCGPYLRLSITLTTSEMFVSGQDDPLTKVAVTGTDGVTQNNPGISAYDCGEPLPYSYDMAPGKTYKGIKTFQIAPGEGASLDLSGSDERVRVLDITGK